MIESADYFAIGICLGAVLFLSANALIFLFL